MKYLPFDYAIRNLWRAPLRMAIAITGCALVVVILMAATSFVQGMRRTLSGGAGSDNVILLGAGSEESLERSQISSAVSAHAKTIPGLRERLGELFVSPEVHMAMILSRPGAREELRGVVRGVVPQALLVHPRVQLTAGRFPQAGQDELMVGALVDAKLGVAAADLAIGKALMMDDREWTIVGQFNAPTAVMDAEIWTSLTDLQVATQRDTLSCVIITLDGAELADIEAWAATRLDLELSALSESEYYAALQRFYAPVRAMIWATAALMSLAGIFGGFNTLYAAFAARTRELGTLQCLGFSRRAIFVSLTQESVMTATIGALSGIGIAYVLLDGQAVRFSMGVFELRLDEVVVSVGLCAGLLLGVLGAVPPALRCLRLPISSALRSS